MSHIGIMYPLATVSIACGCLILPSYQTFELQQSTCESSREDHNYTLQTYVYRIIGDDGHHD